MVQTHALPDKVQEASKVDLVRDSSHGQVEVLQVFVGLQCLEECVDLIGQEAVPRDVEDFYMAAIFTGYHLAQEFEALITQTKPWQHEALKRSKVYVAQTL